MVKTNTTNLLGVEDKKPGHSKTIVFITLFAALLSFLLVSVCNYFATGIRAKLDDGARLYNWKYVSADRQSALFDASAFWKDATKQNPVTTSGGYLRLVGELPPLDTEARFYITTANNKLSVTADGTVLVNTLNGSSPFVGNRETVLSLPASQTDTHLDIIVYTPLGFDTVFAVYKVGEIPTSTLFYTYFELCLTGLFFALTVCLLLIWVAAKSVGKRHILILLLFINLFAGIALFLNRTGIKLVTTDSPIAFHFYLFFTMLFSALTLLPLIGRCRQTTASKFIFICSVLISILVLINLNATVTLLFLRCFGLLQAACILLCLIDIFKGSKNIQSNGSFFALMVVLFMQTIYWTMLLYSENIRSDYLLYYSILILTVVFTVQFVRAAFSSKTTYTEPVAAKSSELLYGLKDQTMLPKAIEALLVTKSDTENHHITHVAEYVKIMCLHMKKSEQEAELISKAALLHDIGKIAVPTRVMFKTEQLTKEEFEQIQNHVFYGYNMLSGSSDDFLNLAAEIAKQHHEYFDGTGYLGIKGKTIHPYARLTAVADVFDALTNSRSYKQAWSFEEGFNYILIHSGDYFDPEIVSVFNESRLDIENAYKQFRSE